MLIFILLGFWTAATAGQWDHRSSSFSASARALACPTLWDPIDGNFPGSSFDRIFQARILEWNAISFSRGSSPHPGIEPVSPGSPALQADSLTAELLGKSVLVNT